MNEAFENELDILRNFRSQLQSEEYIRAFDVAIMAIRLLRGEPSDREMAKKHLTYKEWKEILMK